MVVSARQKVVGPVQLDGYLNVRCAWSCQSKCCVVVWRAASGLAWWLIRDGGGGNGNCRVVFMGCAACTWGLVGWSMVSGQACGPPALESQLKG